MAGGRVRYHPLLSHEERAVLWLKAFHVVAMVTWFAGLFYLPRLFVYHADVAEPAGAERFVVMERRLLTLMTIGGCATVALGLALVIRSPRYLEMRWLHVKLGLVGVLILYHAACWKFQRDFAGGRNRRSARWYRAFNEVPSLLLIGIVVLAVVKPF